MRNTTTSTLHDEQHQMEAISTSIVGLWEIRGFEPGVVAVAAMDAAAVLLIASGATASECETAMVEFSKIFKAFEDKQAPTIQ